MTDINVAIGVTGYGPLWAPPVSSWLRVAAYTGRYFAVESIGKIGGAGVTDRQYTMTAENSLVSDMLADPTFTHLFMSEIDMILPHDTIVKLVALDKDIACGLYFLRTHKPEDRGSPCLYKRSPAIPAKEKKKPYVEYSHTPITLFPKTEPFRIDCGGLGCILLKRKVFETIPYPWFDLKVNGYGSDIYFSKHVKDHGLEMWCDPSVRCGQIDYYETNLDDYEWQLANNPGFASRGFIVGMGGDQENLT